MVKNIQIGIKHIDNGTELDTYIICLKESLGKREFEVVVGIFEAHAIAIVLENHITPKPLTHELVSIVLHTCDVKLKHIIIERLEDNVFLSKATFVANGNEFDVDIRTSDALALATRMGCDMFVSEEVMEAVGYIAEDSDSPYSGHSLGELNAILQSLLEKEDYIKAIKVRDAISNFNKLKNDVDR